MDGQMGWESSLWSNQHNGVEENYVLMNTGLNLVQEPEEINWGDEFFEFGVQSSDISVIFSSDNNNNNNDNNNNINTKSDYIVSNKEPHYHPDDHVNSNQESQRKREFDEISSDYDDNNNNNKNSNQNQRKLGFSLISPKNPNKRARTSSSSSSNISFKNPLSSLSSQSSYTDQEPDPEAVAQMKEMIYRAAALRPVSMAAEAAAERPRRRNVKISRDPQTVAARQRRERISERIRVLQKLVPGGSKMDTASMLDEAASYLKFLRSQVKALENLGRPIDHHHHHHHHLDPSFILMQDQGFFSKPINNC